MECYKIKILKKADKDLDDMLATLIPYGAEFALSKYDYIMASIDKLASFPLMAQEYRYRKEYRCLVVGDYPVFYKVDDKKRLIKVCRIFYGKRDICKLTR